jgi:spoIIIJ-associated protein
MKEYLSIGKNVDAAIEEGLITLGLNREDVDIKILETGGLFKKAKVCLMYEEKVEEKPEIIEQTIEKEEIEPNLDLEKDVEDVQQSEEIEVLEEKVEKETLVNDNKVTDTQEKTTVGPEQLIERVKSFIVELARKMKIEVKVDCVANENDLNFNITGENVGKLIGFRGETMNAIQTLLGGLKRAGEGRYRVYIDIENYKKDREQSIVDLANKMADKAEEIERNVHLEPMNPYERRIVHSTLQNRELVETESMGEGEKRHVVIKFKR